MALMVLWAWVLGAAIGIAVFSKIDVVGKLYYFFVLAGLPLCAFIMKLGTLPKKKYDPRRGNHLLQWIEEQLNVESADETKTEA
jgi:hypothetical protein